MELRKYLRSIKNPLTPEMQGMLQELYNVQPLSKLPLYIKKEVESGDVQAFLNYLSTFERTKITYNKVLDIQCTSHNVFVTIAFVFEQHRLTLEPMLDEVIHLNNQSILSRILQRPSLRNIKIGSGMRRRIDRGMTIAEVIECLRQRLHNPTNKTKKYDHLMLGLFEGIQGIPSEEKTLRYAADMLKLFKNVREVRPKCTEMLRQLTIYSDQRASDIRQLELFRAKKRHLMLVKWEDTYKIVFTSIVDIDNKIQKCAYIVGNEIVTPDEMRRINYLEEFLFQPVLGTPFGYAPSDRNTFEPYESYTLITLAKLMYLSTHHIILYNLVKRDEPSPDRNGGPEDVFDLPPTFVTNEIEKEFTREEILLYQTFLHSSQEKLPDTYVVFVCYFLRILQIQKQETASLLLSLKKGEV